MNEICEMNTNQKNWAKAKVKSLIEMAFEKIK